MRREELQSLTVVELRQMAKTLAVKLTSKMLKADIISAIAAAPPVSSKTAKAGVKGEY